MPRKNLLQLRRGTTSEWLSTADILASGEPGIDIETNILKIGNGTTSWAGLPPIGTLNIDAIYSGFIVKTGDNSYVTRSLNAGPNINLSHGNAVLNNPVIGLSNNITGLTGVQITGIDSSLRFTGINNSGITLKINNNNSLAFNSSIHSDILVVNSSGITSRYAEIEKIENSNINGGFF